MSWRHYSTTFSSNNNAAYKGKDYPCKVSIGGVYTGKQRVFAGYFCNIECNGVNLEHEGQSTLFDVFKLALGEFCNLGYSIDLYGQHENFHETGLSFNSGYGYVPSLSTKAVLMIDEIVS